jgi:hypothetical protein
LSQQQGERGLNAFSERVQGGLTPVSGRRMGAENIVDQDLAVVQTSSPTAPVPMHGLSECAELV